MEVTKEGCEVHVALRTINQFESNRSNAVRPDLPKKRGVLSLTVEPASASLSIANLSSSHHLSLCRREKSLKKRNPRRTDHVVIQPRRR